MARIIKIVGAIILPLGAIWLVAHFLFSFEIVSAPPAPSLQAQKETRQSTNGSADEYVKIMNKGAEALVTAVIINGDPHCTKDGRLPIKLSQNASISIRNFCSEPISSAEVKLSTDEILEQTKGVKRWLQSVAESAREAKNYFVAQTISTVKSSSFLKAIYQKFGWRKLVFAGALMLAIAACFAVLCRRRKRSF